MKKELFIESIDAIEKQYRHDQKCSDAFSVILPDDHISLYDNHRVTNQLTKVLQIAMDDENKGSWIEYYMWELDFGKDWKKGYITIKDKDVPLQNAENLWNLLIDKNK